MRKNYAISEIGSDIVFAVIQNIDSEKLNESNIDLINRVGLALEDECCYEERVKLIHGSIEIEDDATFYISFKYSDEDTEEEIKSLLLRQIAIY